MTLPQRPLKVVAARLSYSSWYLKQDGWHSVISPAFSLVKVSASCSEVELSEKVLVDSVSYGFKSPVPSITTLLFWINELLVVLCCVSIDLHIESFLSS